ncbi:MAG: exo-alpha-sialidase [Candidatus Omnitrophica bacterium]|nr:exo-alpha-sialidase [Candidatus Omnitrophota bacterium]
MSTFFRFFPAFSLILACAFGVRAEPRYTSALIEPINSFHNHGSCIVELPNGDLLASWYKGHGEKGDDSVKIVGARLRKGEEKWSEVFDMADFEGFPDCNSALVVDKEKKLWMFWPLLVANRWETAILMARISTDYNTPGAPNWTWQTPILLKPGDVFAEDVAAAVEEFKKTLPKELVEAYGDELAKLKEEAADKYTRRMGWMPRSKATVLDSGRILMPLYSDGFSFGLVAISDDHGKTWTASRPIISLGGVQPSIVPRSDGSLVAYLRDNGPPPKRVIYSESTDGGMSWSMGKDSELLDSGAGVEGLRLANGHILVIHNDAEKGRHTMAIHLSDDDGKTWKWMRHAERWEPDKGAAAYPSFTLASDGSIIACYTYTNKTDNPGETIKYIRFNEEWIMEGDK